MNKMTVTRAGADTLDFGALAAWMDAQGLPGGPFRDVRLLPGGTQNLNFRFWRGPREYVLRRPPAHPRASSNKALTREAAVLTALAGTDVPHAGLIAYCEDLSVLGGVVFLLTEPVEGVNVTVELPPGAGADPGRRRSLGFAAVDALAAIGLVDYQSVGLHGFGHPEGFLDRQVPRWQAELESYSQLPGYPAGQLPGIDRVADWLERYRPRTSLAGVMHGDFHLGNLLFRTDAARVAAVLDWEMCTVGDPLLDLGRFLAHWPVPGHDMELHGAIYDAGGLPSVGELAGRYAAVSRTSVDQLPWYLVLACYKLGIVLEGTYARACSGQAAPEIGDQLHRTALALLGRALEVIAGE
jgi:aminoglycoside phosphotransferase (APT) family kinase protein